MVFNATTFNNISLISAASVNNAMFQNREFKTKNSAAHECDPKTNFQPYTRL